MAGQNLLQIRKNLSRDYLNLRIEQENNRFYRSCISEGLLFNGIRRHFNLARDVNDDGFVQKIQTNLNEESSRLLDTFYLQSNTKLGELEIKFEESKDTLFEMSVRGRGKGY